MSQGKTKHTCTVQPAPPFGRKTPGCPRCDELIAGAEPRTLGWVDRKRRQEEDDARRVQEIRDHDCRKSGCTTVSGTAVCTFGDW